MVLQHGRINPKSLRDKEKIRNFRIFAGQHPNVEKNSYICREIHFVRAFRSGTYNNL